ncbi:MAG: hypothetical protein RIB71_23075 [Imperialibacter sp.]|uniref:hypothetical protein n=1 Tax=Imperialibacter sp. TaxID=2038411 RepID=UPI0032EC5BB4
MVKVNLETLELIDKENNKHQLFEHEFWFLAPDISKWTEEMGHLPPTWFGMLLHNTKIGEGITPAMTDLLLGITPSTDKKDSAKLAEELLEKIRLEKFANKPSRLRCHFLNYDKKTAIYRANAWSWQNKVIERCYLILSSGYYHYGDVRIYEELTKNPENIALAETYWNTYFPSNDDYTNLEILADSCLYFPEWKEFKEIDKESMVSYSKKYLNDN